MSKASDRAWHLQPDMASAPIESPHPLVTALEELIAKFRWHMDALREWCKHLGMGIREHRIDPDFDPSENDVRLLRRAIEQLLLAKPGGDHYHNGGNEKLLLKWILGIVGTLTVAAVLGGVAIYGEVTATREKMNGIVKTHQVEMAAQGARISRLEDISVRHYREAP